MTFRSQSPKMSERNHVQQGLKENNEIEKFKSIKTKEQSGKKRNFEGDTGGKCPAKKTLASDDGKKPDWKKVKLERKELKQKRKQSSSGGNEIYEVGMNAKMIWEEMRREDCKGSRKVQLARELYALIKGKTKSLIYAHDTVRVIQTLVGVGEEQRTNLFLELKDEILILSKNTYSRFFVIKLLRHGTKEQKNSIMEAMSGHVVELMRHKVACDVLELAYNDYANARQRSNMIQEFFGPRFKHFKEDIPTLNAAIEKHPDLKESILSDVNKALQPILDKGVFTNTLIHTLLKEYLYSCREPERRGIIENIREGLLSIIHTRDGARVAMLCLWNGTPKDRKVILKSFKGKFVKIALEKHGQMVLLAAFDCIDDTVLVKKVALSELMEGLNELVENETGKKVLKYLVSPRNRLYFHPHILALLHEGDNNPHSKKDRTIKYKELQESITKPVLKLIHDNINSWARDSHWTLLISSILQSLSDDSVIPIFESIAEICVEPFVPGEENHFLEVSYMAKMVSFIIECDKERFQEKKPFFSSYLLEAAETEMRGWALTNRGCFILLKLLKTTIPEIVEKVSKICLPLKPRLPKMNFPGAEILLKWLNNNKD